MFDYFDEQTFKSVIPTSKYTPNMTRVQHAREMSIDKNVELLQDNQAKRLYLDYRLFGKHPPEYDDLIHSAFRYRKDLLLKVSNILLSYNLYPGTYMAMHVRRGDFKIQYPQIGHITNTQIFNHVKHGIDKSTLLIISDERDEKLIDMCKMICNNVICWTGQRDTLINSMLIDMLCCVPAKRFFATPLSTLSSGIVTLRKRVGTHRQRDFTIPFDYNQMPHWGKD